MKKLIALLLFVFLLLTGVLFIINARAETAMVEPELSWTTKYSRIIIPADCTFIRLFLAEGIYQADYKLPAYVKMAVVWFRADKFEKGITLKSSWTYNGKVIVASKTTTFLPGAGDKNEIWFQLSKSGRDLPAGNYMLFFEVDNQTGSVAFEVSHKLKVWKGLHPKKRSKL